MSLTEAIISQTDRILYCTYTQPQNSKQQMLLRVCVSVLVFSLTLVLTKAKLTRDSGSIYLKKDVIYFFFPPTCSFMKYICSPFSSQKRDHYSALQWI